MCAVKDVGQSALPYKCHPSSFGVGQGRHAKAKLVPVNKGIKVPLSWTSSLPSGVKAHGALYPFTTAVRFLGQWGTNGFELESFVPYTELQFLKS